MCVRASEYLLPLTPKYASMKAACADGVSLANTDALLSVSAPPNPMMGCSSFDTLTVSVGNEGGPLGCVNGSGAWGLSSSWPDS